MLDTIRRNRCVARADTIKVSNFGSVPRSVLTSRVWSQKRTYNTFQRLSNERQGAHKK